jgi:lipid II:glycine glycyltransferase (peptidoglycan interpeptide bridge formation enzyme)
MSFHVEIKELDGSNTQKWDALVEKSPQSTPFHKFEWLKLMEKYTNTRLLLLVGLDGEEIFAAVPLFIQKPFKGLITKVFSPPYPTQVPYLGPIFLAYNEWKENLRETRLRVFHQELDKYIRTEIRPHATLIVTTPDLVDARPYLITGYDVLPKFTYSCDISDIEKVWNGFAHDLRNHLVKTEDRGVQIKEGKLDEFNFTMNLLDIRLKEKEKSLDVANKYFVEIYHKFFPNNLKILIAEYKDKNLSGLIFLMNKEKIWLWMGIPRINLKGVYPNNLLIWKAIEWANGQGYRYCEIIDAHTNASFKAAYNFNLVLYYSINKYSKKYKFAADISRIIKS